MEEILMATGAGGGKQRPPQQERPTDKQPMKQEREKKGYHRSK